MASPSRAPSRHIAPRTPYEEVIAGIWRDVLDRSHLGVSDDFFELGGHSLLAPKVTARIRKILGVRVSVKEFFAAPTVAGLAAAVAARASSGASAAEPRAADAGPRAADAEPVLSFDQERLWLENQLRPGTAYNVHGRRRLTGPLDVAAMEGGIRAILLRHETLRTRFPTVDGRPVQVVDDLGEDWRLEVVEGADEDEARRLADEQATAPFDLARGPLFRCLLVKLGDTEHVLAVTMHHIISDAWSVGLLVRELSALYEAGGDAERAGLAELPIQYRDYAVWQRAALTGEALQREVGYWREHLADAPPPLVLPLARRFSPARGARGERLRFDLSPEETGELHALCREHGVTPFMVVLASLATTLSRWSGQRDMVIGVPVAGRTDEGTDRLIGFFVNTLPFRVDLSGEPTFADLLGRVRRVALDGYAHSDAPFDVLVKELRVPRDPRRTPLFQVLLNVIDGPVTEEITGVAVEPMETPALDSKFDLMVSAQEVGSALQVHLEFNAERYQPAMMRVLAEHLRVFLRAAVEDPARELPDYPPHAVEEAPAGDWPVAEPHRAVDRFARGRDRVAVVDRDGEWSYRRLSRAADRVARVLSERAASQTEHFGVVRRASAAFVAAVLGCGKAGATFSVIEEAGPVAARYLGVSAVVDVRPGSEADIDLSPIFADVNDTDGTPAPGDPGRAETDWAVRRFGLDEDDRFAVLSALPGHLASAMSSALSAGAVLLLPERGDLAWLRENAATVAYLTPAILRGLDAAHETLPALRYAFIENSGELISHDLVALRHLAPRCRGVGVHRVGRDGRPLAAYPVPADWQPQTAGVRVPLSGDPADDRAELRHPGGRPAAVGEVAELCSGSQRTGDLARRWTDGTLEFVGRADADPVETLAALRDGPDVRDALVTEHVAADGRIVLVGYLAGPDPALGTVRIRQYLLTVLPDSSMPERLFVLDRLPRTRDGDYDLDALPVPDGSGPPDDYAAPSTPIEHRLTAIFEELLGIDRVGVHDTFFELSGFSLLATQLASRIRDTFGIELSLREVFGSPTVESLAQLVVRAQGELYGADDLEALLNEIESADREHDR
ncbi:condensation domain-containing protein [Planomonospora sp. ID82291]|uniref:condensation domain-containing protein n=1 Tax=Planomonospora sp. ID82291 TaxID=2738136 RepID=UPI0018C38D87|nr:condensation domain-containing protein [Planomonospora sp. ID82291]MBG0816340.1 AMP-binding protein [Planomonospora sp. ID82291]